LAVTVLLYGVMVRISRMFTEALVLGQLLPSAVRSWPTSISKSIKLLFNFAAVYIVGFLILLLTSLPVSLNNGTGLGGFLPAILIIGIRTGGIKANVSPLICRSVYPKVNGH
jgi:hypothetical protein